MKISEQDLEKAIGRIALTPDGLLLYRYLQKELEEVLLDPGASDGALRANHGRRMFAAKLMAMMSEGIDESGRRTTDGSGRASDAPVVFDKRKPVEHGRRQSVREYLVKLDEQAGGKRAS